MMMTLHGCIHWLACVPRPDGPIAELLRMAWQFLSLSLFSLGGGNTLLAAYHHLSVEQFCWLTNNQFADIYALSEAAPGPSSMIAGLIGMSSALGEGLPWELMSAYTAETALLLPSTLVMIVACLGWKRFSHSPWRVAFERGMGPVTLGILFSVGLKILRTANHDIGGYMVSAIVCVLMLRTRISPLWFMAVAGVLGAWGLNQR
jgi:chromate transporter